MACAWLSLAHEGERPAGGPDIPRALRGRLDERAWQQVAGLVRSGVRAPVTSSMGRLFDAVAALCGLRTTVNYEGQAAIELEAACDPSERGSYPVALQQHRRLTVIDPRETIHAICADVEAGVAAAAIASRFHAGLSAATVQALARAASAAGTELVVLSGGVFQNRRLLEAVMAGLHASGLRAIVPERLPIGDGGVSYGQAAIAARRVASAASLQPRP
jgi:hydrogenase maturation protein HypF